EPAGYVAQHVGAPARSGAGDGCHVARGLVEVVHVLGGYRNEPGDQGGVEGGEDVVEAPQLLIAIQQRAEALLPVNGEGRDPAQVVQAAVGERDLVTVGPEEPGQTVKGAARRVTDADHPHAAVQGDRL